MEGVLSPGVVRAKPTRDVRALDPTVKPQGAVQTTPCARRTRDAEVSR
jgi:hypothetical protein